MASIGTPEKSGNLGILSTLAKFGRAVCQKFTLMFVQFTYIVQCKYHEKRLISVLPIQISATYVRNKGISRAKIEKKIRAVQKIPGEILPVN